MLKNSLLRPDLAYQSVAKDDTDNNVDREEARSPSSSTFDDEKGILTASPYQDTKIPRQRLLTCTIVLLCVLSGLLIALTLQTLHATSLSQSAVADDSAADAASEEISRYLDIHPDVIRAPLLNPRPWNYSHPVPSPCGHTPATAREANCKFSAMTFGWYPTACYDFELEAAFLSLADWTWHTDESLSADSVLPREEVLRGDFGHAWVSADFHKMHCVYSMRKLLRAVLGVALSDNYVVRMGHLMHCEHFTEIVETQGVTAAQGVTKYFDCLVM